MPAAKRKWGYYVLPFRLGDRIVARVDLKADRQAQQLLVLNAHEEDCTNSADCCEHLAIELHALKDWLCFEEIRVTRTNEFTRNLANTI